MPSLLDDLDSELRIDPVRGYKQAHLQVTSEGILFQATSQDDVRYGLAADAICYFDEYRYASENPKPKPNCAPPGLDCHCGFYAWKTSDKVPRFPALDCRSATVTLIVDLYGFIIEHEKGYRAQHQRVMQVEIPPCYHLWRATKTKVIQTSQAREEYYPLNRWSQLEDADEYGVYECRTPAKYLATKPVWSFPCLLCEDCAVKEAPDEAITFHPLTSLPGLPGLEWVDAPTDIY